MAVHCGACRSTRVLTEADRYFCIDCGAKTDSDGNVVGDGLLTPVPSPDGPTEES